MNVINRAEKVDEQIGVICPASMFLSRIIVCKLSKKVLCNFVLTSVKVEVNLLKQFTYMYLKVLITVFQKMLRGLSHRSMKKGLSYPSWDVNDKNIKKDADAAEI